MRRESGDKESRLWLIGDSSPARWSEHLDEPLDSRHPARHNIWTPVLEGIQKQLFLPDRRRLDDARLYVRNAVHNPEDKPPYNDTAWEKELVEKTASFGKLLELHRPPLVFTFGAFAFEFSRRACGKEPKRSSSHWTTKRLGEEFRGIVKTFEPQCVNVFPLLHASIARGQFLKAHADFTGEGGQNYFDAVAGAIAALLLEHRGALDVWVEPS